MRTLITGGAGCLGQYLFAHRRPGFECQATWHRTECPWRPAHQVDLGDRTSVNQLMSELQPELIIHTAYGKEDVDRDIVQATQNIVDSAVTHAARLLFVSSDLVLDGQQGPYSEAAEPKPLMAYGRAKAEAEAYVTAQLPRASILRTSLILGLEPLNASSDWIVQNLRDGREITLFVDELRNPIGAADLADMIWDIAELPPGETAGVWNLVGPEALSRYSIGLLLAQRFGCDPGLIRAARSSDSSTPRPRDLRMTTARADAALKTHPRTASEVLCG